MRKNYLLSILFVAVVLVLSACYSKKKITYFYDLEDTPSWSAPIENNIVPKFQEGDRINVEVKTIDKGTSDFLSSGAIINSNTSQEVGADNGSSSKPQGYEVDVLGDIHLPYIGKIQAAGLTKEELKTSITKEISKYVKNPTVYVDWLNFKYTVLGQVNASGIFQVDGEKINILEALAKAGDVTNTSEINEILLIREENGNRGVVKLNLQDSELMNSPYYYLKQHDILYVPPTKYADAKPSSQFRQLTLLTTLTSLSGTIIAIISLTRK